MERVLAANGLELAGLPEGKRIAWIRVVRDEVFVTDEIWPLFLNWFHMTTKEQIVRRELLFREGEAYTEARIDETMRNLRGMGIFSLVRIVAVQVPDSDAVGVVVHTRDRWSLRLETDFSASTILDQLVVTGTERNFLGRNQALSVELDLLPFNHAFTQGYESRRVAGSTVRLTETAGAIFNNKSGNAEGATGSVQLGEPFYNLKQQFAWTASGAFDDYVARQSRLRKLRTYPEAATGPDMPVAQRAWRQRNATGSLIASYRVGELFKQTWSGGFDYRSVHSHTIAETMLPAALRDAFVLHVLPRQRTEVGPIFTYDILLPEFMRFQNLATFGQTENVRIGPSASLTVRTPLRAFGSSTNSYVFTSTVGYILAPAGFLLEGSVAGRTRYENQQLVDQRFSALVRGATPVLFRSFRVVSRVALIARRHDTANTYVALGASDGLRGYTSAQIAGYGASSLLANVEIRTLPIEWEAVHVGGVIFYDTGTVYNQLAQLRMHRAVGVGLRVLLPQLNRTPFSFDAATRLDPSFRIVPTIEDGQVTPLTASEDPLP
jgi:hypothetical protein